MLHAIAQGLPWLVDSATTILTLDEVLFQILSDKED